MVDATGSGDIVDQCAGRASELVVEGDAGGEGEEALEDAFAEAVEGAGAVAFEGEEVFARPEDRLDSLPDRREVWALTGLVSAARTHDRGVEGADGAGEVAAGVVLVADDGFASVTDAALQQGESDLAVVALGRGERDRPLGCRRARTARAA